MLSTTGHQKKIMLAIDRLKRLKSTGKRVSAMDGRTASLELLEPPPPAPPISGRWSGGEGMGAIPPHVYDVGGARPKKSPSGDSISTTSSGNSGSGSSGAGSGSHPYHHGGEMRVIPLPREDASVGGVAGGIPYRHNSTGSSSGLQPDVVAIQVKRNLRGSVSEDKRGPVNSQGANSGYFQQHQFNQHQQQQQQLMYHSFQGPVRRTSESDVFADTHPQIRSFEAEDRRRPSMPVEFESDKHEAELNSEANKNFFPPKVGKAGLGNGTSQGSLRVETGEHIYDTPQISPSQKSPRPAVMPKPSVSFAPVPNQGMAGSLHVNTTADVSQPQSKSSPSSSKGGKKVPPPPPIRTDSIRGDSAPSKDGVPPGSPSRGLNSGQPAQASTVSVSASIHPPPPPHASSSSSSSAPVSAPPKVAAKPTPPPVMQKPQLNQSAVAAKIQQHQQQQQQQQNNSAQQHSSPAHAVATPGQPPAHSASNVKPGQHQQQGRPEPAVLIKPKVSTGSAPPYGGQQATKSPLPAKAPFGAGPASSIASSQSQQSHPMGKPQSVTTAPDPVHSQALSSCMKSLSEKIAGRNLQQQQQKEEKEKDEEDQFPDNVSTDSDDFPPPPPPIAMDIITPKIHNYGIPSTRKPGDFGLPHRPGLVGSPRMMAGGPGMSPRGIGAGGMNTTVSYAEVHHRPDAATSRTAPLQTSSGMGAAGLRIQPTGHGHMGGPHALQHNRQPPGPYPMGLGSGPVSSSAAASTGSPSKVPSASNTATTSIISSSMRGHHQPRENIPEPAHPMSTENRSDSTTSFESTSSSSSMDSNTLPFANENVGTIKQRAAATTTSGDTITSTTTTAASVTSNSSLPSAATSVGQGSARRGSQDHESHRPVPGGFPPSSSTTSSSTSSPSFPHHQRQPSGKEALLSRANLLLQC